MKFCFIDSEVFISNRELIAPLEALGEVSVYDGIPETVDDAVRRAGDADVILFSLMQFTNEILDRLPKLKILQFIGTGVWNFVDVKYAEAKGILVQKIEGYGSNAVAEFAVTTAMALSRHLTQADRIMKTEKWTIDGLCGFEIARSTIGVIGTGNIGSLVAKKFISLGARVLACDIYENEELKKDYGVEYGSMEEVFSHSDIVTLHMKATPENERCIGKSLFQVMKPGALLVNVARAELINSKDLYDSLRHGNLGGVAIDVYNREPPGAEEYDFISEDNVIATPHIGYYTQDAAYKSVIMAVNTVIQSLKNI